ncbi:flagellar hook-associated protein FlgK [Chengkuizengella axinellae]|uniref:Flagellar hook-associated protein 1 n=1 Tax=Chengkuizengella axinellae TaxID=3064388 RepID=A0ABT9J376_9BACL|nr:flagellar hook-associated protein FlgK [Chengkuizengella sp. 2205SS18-9]MDP5275882.1 flagellar hook-associated protein FlgK [Chengkuizengella sp. 2205SS18-9]
MGSTFGGIEIAKRSLTAQQIVMNTIGHNIANANTVGYTRQSVNLVASKPLEAPGLMNSTNPGQIGQGVEYDSINRIRDSFLDDQYRNEQKYFGEWSIKEDTLQKLEAIFNEPSETGITQVIEKFWNAWQDLSGDPENITARAALKENALALTDTLNQLDKQLSDFASDLTENINVKATEADNMLTQIASLNNEIFRIEGLGNNANDLRDQRDVLVDELSKIVNIDVEEKDSGYSITMGSVSLVNGINKEFTFDESSIESSISSGHLNSGEIYGMVYSRDEYVADYSFQLDAMVKALVEGDIQITLPEGAVIPEGTTLNGVTYTGTVEERTLDADTEVTVQGLNGLHALGYSLEDPTQSGIPFFTLKDGATEWDASSITLNPDIEANPSLIAASSRVDENGDVVFGNNDISLLIAGIRNEDLSYDSGAAGDPVLSNGTFDEFFRSMIGQLGVQSQEASRQVDNQEVLVQQVEINRLSVSGVSLDEELADMLKFEQAYNASARMLTTIDELLNKLINGTGRVGL